MTETKGYHRGFRENLIINVNVSILYAENGMPYQAHYVITPHKIDIKFKN